MTKNDSIILEVADIGEVATMPTLHTDFTIFDVKIIAVMELQDNKTCLRCSMSQLYDCCPNQLTGKLLFISRKLAQQSQRTITLTLPGSLLKELAHPGEVTERKLLSLSPIKQVTYDDSNTAVSIVQLHVETYNESSMTFCTNTDVFCTEWHWQKMMS